MYKKHYTYKSAGSAYVNTDRLDKHDMPIYIPLFATNATRK